LLAFDGRGIGISYPPNMALPYTVVKGIITKIFDDAGIKYTGGWQKGFNDDSLIVDIGSRPPNW
jgi:hypothetical protein